jgi:Zn-dependent protease with chaperone function
MADCLPADKTTPAQGLDRPPKLNVFALPTRTTILFALIVVVILLPALASLAGDTPVCEPFIVFWMLLLPLRSFLRRPDQEIQRGHMAELAPRFPVLARHIERLAAQLGLQREPRLLVSTEKETGPRTFGSFTRHYLAIPADRAPALQAALESHTHDERCGVEAILLHELSHFANRDIVPAFFSRSLLWVALGFMTFNLLVNLLNPFLYNALVGFFDFTTMWPPELLQMMESSNPEMARALLNPPKVGPATWVRYELYVFSAHWPLIVGSLILLVFFWRALLRTRELYADARVAQWQGTTRFIHQEILRETVRRAIRPVSGFPRLPAWLHQGMGFLSSGRATSFLAHHPDLSTRQACLERPDRVYSTDLAIAVTAGVTVILLNLTLGSLFLSRYLRGPNATVPFVLGFTILSLSLLPHLCVFAGPSSELRGKIARLVLVFTGIKLVPQYALGLSVAATVIIDPQVIELAAYTLVGAGGENLPPLGVPVSFVLEMFVLRPAILFTIVMPITLILLLLLDARLKQMALTWYGAPLIQKHPVALFWGLTGWLALVLWFVVLPVYNVATVPTAHTLFDPLILGRMVLTLLISAVGVIFFAMIHRRYAGRCPRCTGVISSPYRLGMTCPHCSELLHPWLLANY